VGSEVLIAPTIGRMVWVEPAKAADGRHNPALPLAATIVDVIDDRHISVTAFNQHGVPRAFLNIPLLQEADPVPVRELTAEEEQQLAHADPDAKPVFDQSVTYARWMPYQIGQAKAQGAQAPLTPKPAPARAPAKP
jgi:hypothetical protein